MAFPQYINCIYRPNHISAWHIAVTSNWQWCCHYYCSPLKVNWCPVSALLQHQPQPHVSWKGFTEGQWSAPHGWLSEGGPWVVQWGSYHQGQCGMRGICTKPMRSCPSPGPDVLLSHMCSHSMCKKGKDCGQDRTRRYDVKKECW